MEGGNGRGHIGSAHFNEIVMQFLSKKDCPHLLAQLGEECWYTAKSIGEEQPFCSIAWVQGRVVTVQNIKEHQLLRVTAVLSTKEEDLVEHLMETASLREAGACHFSVRELEGFLLAQAECYEPLGSESLGEQIKMLFRRLEFALSEC